MSVRTATEDDADAIERVRIDTWKATYRGLLPDAILDAMRPNAEARRERLRRLSADQCWLVAESEGRVVGFAMAGPERGGDAEYKGEVYAIYVLPPHQGKGLGRELIRASALCLAERGMTSLLIWVLGENAIGRRFYERLGGRPAREKPVDIPGAEDRVEIGYGWSDTASLR